MNLVSQRPSERQRQALLNASTQQAADATLWLVEPPRGKWAGSVLGGFHGQKRQDVDDDGWSDLPSFARGVPHRCIFTSLRKISRTASGS